MTKKHKTLSYKEFISGRKLKPPAKFKDPKWAAGAMKDAKETAKEREKSNKRFRQHQGTTKQ